MTFVIPLLAALGVGSLVSVCAFVLHRTYRTRWETERSVLQATIDGFDDMAVTTLVPLSVIAVCPDSKKIAFANRSFTALTGVIDPKLPPLITAMVADEHAEAISALVNGEATRPVDTQIFAKGTHTKVRIHPLARGPMRDGYVPLAVEVTEDPKAGQLALLGTGIQRSHGALLTLNKAGKITYANPAAVKLYGRSEQELIGSELTSWNIFTLGEDERGTNPTEIARKHGEFSAEVLRICEDGACRATQIDITFVPQAMDDDSSIIVALEDRSRETSVREDVVKLHKLAGLGEIASGLLTHELANPLTSALENARYIIDCFEQGDVDDTVADAARDAVEAAERMRDIIDAVRDFGHIDDDKRSASTDDAVKAALTLVKPLLERRIEIIRPETEGPKMRTDKGRLTQVMVNLLKNAAEAIRKGKGQGTICIEHGVTQDTGWIRVVDDGPGIPEDVVANIFEERFGTGAGKGSGFGLPLCAKLIEDHDGKIDVESRMGLGTMFTVRYPIAVTKTVTNSEDLILSADFATGEVESTLDVRFAPEVIAAFNAKLAAQGREEMLEELSLPPSVVVSEVPFADDTRVGVIEEVTSTLDLDPAAIIPIDVQPLSDGRDFMLEEQEIGRQIVISDDDDEVTVRTEVSLEDLVPTREDLVATREDLPLMAGPGGEPPDEIDVAHVLSRYYSEMDQIDRLSTPPKSKRKAS